MAGFWAVLALALVIASIVIVVLGIQLAAAMWLVLLAIFIVLFTGDALLGEAHLSKVNNKKASLPLHPSPVARELSRAAAFSMSMMVRGLPVLPSSSDSLPAMPFASSARAASHSGSRE